VTAQIEGEIRSFINDELVEPGDELDLPANMSLLDGFLDSFGLMVLINFLEERYGISIANDEMVPENFGSVGTLAVFVQEKTAEAPARSDLQEAPEGR
jgi:acyl carrier protein